MTLSFMVKLGGKVSDWPTRDPCLPCTSKPRPRTQGRVEHFTVLEEDSHRSLDTCSFPPQNPSVLGLNQARRQQEAYLEESFAQTQNTLKFHMPQDSLFFSTDISLYQKFWILTTQLPQHFCLASNAKAREAFLLNVHKIVI